MTKKTNQTETQSELVAGKDIGIAPKNVNFVNVSAASEDSQNFVPGKNWAVGQTLSGSYVRTDRIYSDKFKAGKKDSEGRTYRDLHVLEDITNHSTFGIWSVGVLTNFFDQVPVGAPVSITYTGIADEPLKPGQSAPHTFTTGLGEGYRLQRKSHSPEQHAN